MRVMMDIPSGDSIVALVQSDESASAPTFSVGSRVTCVLPPAALRVLPLRARADEPLLEQVVAS
jgi:hypothetical protein